MPQNGKPKATSFPSLTSRLCVRRLPKNPHGYISVEATSSAPSLPPSSTTPSTRANMTVA